MSRAAAPGSPQVLIIGAGVGGLCLAQGLAGAGIGVAVYERDSSASAATSQYQYPLGLRQSGVQALRDCLPLSSFDLCMATSVRLATRVVLLDQQLQATFSRPVAHPDPVLAGFSVNRLTLREILLAGLDGVVHFGKAFECFELTGGGQVSAHFADGTTALGHLLVGADGAGSAVRAQLLPDAEVYELSWLIYGRTPITSGLLDATPAVLVDTLNRVAGPAGAAVSIATCRAIEPAGRAAARLAPAVQLTDVPGYFSWAMPLTDPRLRAADGPALHRAAVTAAEGMHPAVRRILIEADVPATFPVCVTSAQPVAPWRCPAVTLLGDAIHAMSPIRGDGASIALQDAGVLCRALLDVAAGRTGLGEASAGYAAQMLSYGFQAVAESLNRPFARGLTETARDGPVNPDVRYAVRPVWDIGRPQPELARLAERGALTGRVLDTGCGTGEHVLLCAALGLDATGIDLAQAAIDEARRKAAERGLTARFLVGDVLDLPGPAERFDTVIDCGLFHDLATADRSRFARALHRVLSPGGRYYLLCFSAAADEEDSRHHVRQQDIRDCFGSGWNIESIDPARLILIGNPDAQAWLATITRTP